MMTWPRRPWPRGMPTAASTASPSPLKSPVVTEYPWKTNHSKIIAFKRIKNKFNQMVRTLTNFWHVEKHRIIESLHLLLNDLAIFTMLLGKCFCFETCRGCCICIILCELISLHFQSWSLKYANCNITLSWDWLILRQPKPRIYHYGLLGRWNKAPPRRSWSHLLFEHVVTNDTNCLNRKSW